MYMSVLLLDKPDVNKPESWIFYILATWPLETKEDHENTDNRLERLRAHMDGWADPAKSAVAWLPDDIPIGKDQLRIWHPKPWDNRAGRVTLSGDAAHRYFHGTVAKPNTYSTLQHDLSPRARRQSSDQRR